ncbi:MAG: hypothetical protein P4L10_13705 [Acidobacteriaceae bacterium]|nr:hypothetical protein [Acidobacteriaceae bacterium]
MSENSSKPPVEARTKGMLLPGVAAIAIYMLFMALMNAFGAIHGMFRTPAANYSVLGVCTLLAVGVFGLLRMRRWGWALVLGGAVFLALGDLLFFKMTRTTFFAVRSVLEMVFFLYLVRGEVRERLR